MTMHWRKVAISLIAFALGAGPIGAAAQELTLLTTVTRVVNLPMLVGLRLLEREDGIKVVVRDLRSPEAVMLALIDGQGQLGTGFAPFYPAVEKGAGERGVLELSRPEFVVMAKKEIQSVDGLTGIRIASHSPKSTLQSLIQVYLRTHPTIKPNFVFMPAGSGARAQALLNGAIDAAGFDLSAAAVVNGRAPGKFHVLIDFTGQAVSSSVLVANADFAKKRPDIMQKVVRRILESYRAGLRDPRYWVRERGDVLKELDDAKLEAQLRALAKIFDPNGGLDRMRGQGAMANISFQVAAGNLSEPASKWKPEMFYNVEALEAALKGMR